MVSILGVISYLLMAVVVVAWLVSVTAAFELVTKHRPEGRSMADYANGTSWFGPDAFTPSGDAARRRMHRALMVFFGIAFGVAALTIGETMLAG